MAEPPEGVAAVQMQEEVETEVAKETDQISVGTGEGSEAGEGHIAAFHLVKANGFGHNNTVWNFLEH